MFELHGEFRRKAGDPAYPLMDHLDAYGDVADQFPFITVVECPGELHLPYFADIMQKCAVNQQVTVEALVERHKSIYERGVCQGVFEDPAQIDMMHPLGRRSNPVKCHQLRISEEVVQQTLQPVVGKCADESDKLALHYLDIPVGLGQEIAQYH